MRWYPGSPVLIADSLRKGDRYVACELRPEEHDAAGRAAARDARASRLGRRTATRWCAPSLLGDRRRLVLIDPPFERPDDYVRCAATAGALMQQDPETVIAIWLPIKDMETFDGFLRRLADAGVRRALVAEARLRPLTNPMTDERLRGGADQSAGGRAGGGAGRLRMDRHRAGRARRARRGLVDLGLRTGQVDDDRAVVRAGGRAEAALRHRDVGGVIDLIDGHAQRTRQGGGPGAGPAGSVDQTAL